MKKVLLNPVEPVTNSAENYLNKLSQELSE